MSAGLRMRNALAACWVDIVLESDRDANTCSRWILFCSISAWRFRARQRCWRNLAAARFLARRSFGLNLDDDADVDALATMMFTESQILVL